MATKPSAKSVIEETIQSHAHAVVTKMSDREVMAALKEQGIGTLEELVAHSLRELKARPIGGGVVARDTFIYTQAVYKTAMPIDNELINELKNKIGQ